MFMFSFSSLFVCFVRVCCFDYILHVLILIFYSQFAPMPMAHSYTETSAIRISFDWGFGQRPQATVGNRIEVEDIKIPCANQLFAKSEIFHFVGN